MPIEGGMGEFGVPSRLEPAHSSSSQSRRALPTQPPSAMATASSSGSTGAGRRPLPTPPGGLSVAKTATVELSPHPPPQRPSVATHLPSANSRRALPTLPPASTEQARKLSLGNAPRAPPLRPEPSPSSSVSNRGFRDTTAPGQPADRVPLPRKDLHGLPVSLTSPNPYDMSAGPSRQLSLSHSASFSSEFSRTIASSPSMSETTPTSLATSHISHDGWRPSLNRFGETEGFGTDVAFRLPFLERPPSPSTTGRETPTPTNSWADRQNLTLSAQPRRRQASSSTVGAVDAGLPETPGVVPMRMLKQRSFLDGPSNGTARDTSSPDSGVGQASISRHSSSASGRSMRTRDSDVSSAQRAPFPEPHPNLPRRQISNPSSLHPQSLASFNSRMSVELSPSWAEQSRPPAHWVERKLQIHDLHRSEVDGENLLPGSEYEDEDGDWGEDEEEEPEVNEIHFFQPAFLSEAALQLKDRVERRRQTKAGIAWVGAFTGRDIVVSRSRTHNTHKLMVTRGRFRTSSPLTPVIRRPTAALPSSRPSPSKTSSGSSRLIGITDPCVTPPRTSSALSARWRV